MLEHSLKFQLLVLLTAKWYDLYPRWRNVKSSWMISFKIKCVFKLWEISTTWCTTFSFRFRKQRQSTQYKRHPRQHHRYLTWPASSVPGARRLNSPGLIKKGWFCFADGVKCLQFSAAKELLGYPTWVLPKWCDRVIDQSGPRRDNPP